MNMLRRTRRWNKGRGNELSDAKKLCSDQSEAKNDRAELPEADAVGLRRETRDCSSPAVRRSSE